MFSESLTVHYPWKTDEGINAKTSFSEIVYICNEHVNHHSWILLMFYISHLHQEQSQYGRFIHIKKLGISSKNKLKISEDFKINERNLKIKIWLTSNRASFFAVAFSISLSLLQFLKSLSCMQVISLSLNSALSWSSVRFISSLSHISNKLFFC